MLNNLRSELEALASIGSVIARLILKFGREGIGSPRPPGLECGEMKRCYRNAANAAYGRYHYVEGYALRSGLPISLEHAWLLDTKTNSFVDPTWPEPEDNAYFGIVFRGDYLRSTLLKRRRYGLLNHNLFKLPPETYLEESVK